MHPAHREEIRFGLTFADCDGNDLLILEVRDTAQYFVAAPVGEIPNSKNKVNFTLPAFRGSFVSWTALPESVIADYRPESLAEALNYAHSIALIENSIHNWANGYDPAEALREVQRTCGEFSMQQGETQSSESISNSTPKTKASCKGEKPCISSLTLAF